MKKLELINYPVYVALWLFAILCVLAEFFDAGSEIHWRLFMVAVIYFLMLAFSLVNILINIYKRDWYGAAFGSASALITYIGLNLLFD